MIVQVFPEVMALARSAVEKKNKPSGHLID